MSQCRVPTWNLKHQKQEERVELGVERNRSLGVHSKQNPPPLVPMANYEVAEITWENGQLAMHGHGRTNDTLESIVHQATTCHHQSPNQLDQNLAHIGSLVASSSRKCADNSAQYVQMAPSHLKKKPRSESHECGRNFSTSVQDSRHFDRSVCASISATISKDNDTTMITWPSFDSPNWSLKSNKTTDDDSACQDGSDNQEEECKNEGETVRSRPIRRSRAAAIHNQSERKRRERINQKMKALQKLVPNSSKTDKASMLDEVIEYLKQLQAQVQMMRNMPQMMMPLQLQQQQQQLQMSILARIGMGLMMPPQAAPPVPTATPPFVPPPFMAAPPPFMAAPPPMINPARQGGAAPATNNHAAPYCDPYSAFLAQSMSIDLYNKMAALYRQQVNQAAQPMPKPSQSKHF